MMTAPNNNAASPLSPHDGHGHGSNGDHDGDAHHDPASAAIMSYKPPGFSYNIRQIARDSLAVLREGVFGVMDTRTAPRLNAFVQVLSKNGITVYKSEPSKGARGLNGDILPSFFKAQMEVPDLEPAAVFRLFDDPATRRQWDTSLRVHDTLAIVNDDIRFVYTSTKAVGPVAARDYVDLRRRLLVHGGHLMCGGCSVHYPADLPAELVTEAKLCLRGFNHSGSGFVASPASLAHTLATSIRATAPITVTGSASSRPSSQPPSPGQSQSNSRTTSRRPSADQLLSSPSSTNSNGNERIRVTSPPAIDASRTRTMSNTSTTSNGNNVRKTSRGNDRPASGLTPFIGAAMFPSIFPDLATAPPSPYMERTDSGGSPSVSPADTDASPAVVAAPPSTPLILAAPSPSSSSLPPLPELDTTTAATTNTHTLSVISENSVLTIPNGSANGTGAEYQSKSPRGVPPSLAISTRGSLISVDGSGTIPLIPETPSMALMATPRAHYIPDEKEQRSTPYASGPPSVLGFPKSHSSTSMKNQTPTITPVVIPSSPVPSSPMVIMSPSASSSSLTIASPSATASSPSPSSSTTAITAPSSSLHVNPPSPHTPQSPAPVHRPGTILTLMFQTEIGGSVPKWLASTSFPRSMYQMLNHLRTYIDQQQRRARADALQREREQEEKDRLTRQRRLHHGPDLHADDDDDDEFLPRAAKD